MINLAKQAVIFRQSIWISLLSLIAITVFIRLGFWQLKRAEEKKNLTKMMEQRLHSPAIHIHAGNMQRLAEPQLAYRKVILNGYFVAQQLYFLDNKKYQGQAGFEVITPFRLENSQRHILVNRGWVAMLGSRNQLPEIHTSEHLLSLSGPLVPAPNKHYRPGIKYPAKQLGGIWLYTDIAYLEKLAGYDIYPLLLLQQDSLNKGSIARKINLKNTSGMHIAYALQWFAFATSIVLIYLWLIFKMLKPGENNQ